MKEEDIIKLSVLAGMEYQLKNVPFGNVVDNVSDFIKYLENINKNTPMAKDAYDVMMSIKVAVNKALELYRSQLSEK